MPKVLHSTSFWIDFNLVAALLFLSESSRGIVIPTLTDYNDQLGGSSFFLSVLVSSFSVGRLIATFFFGAVGNSKSWSTRISLLLATVMCIIGNIIFISADLIGSGTGGLMVLLTSRIFLGFGTGILTIARTWVSRYTFVSERTKFISFLGIVEFVGFSFTPAVGGLDINFNIGSLTIKPITFGAYLLCIFDIIVFFLIFFLMKNIPTHFPGDRGNNKSLTDDNSVAEAPDRSPGGLTNGSPPLPLPPPLANPSLVIPSATLSTLEKKFSSESYDNNQNDAEYNNTSHSLDNKLNTPLLDKINNGEHPPVNIIIPILYIFLNTSIRGCLAVAETYATILYFHVTNTNDSSIAGFYFTGFGCFGVLTFLLVPKIAKRIKDVYLLLFGLSCCGCGFLLIFSFGMNSSNSSDEQTLFINYIIGSITIWSLTAPFCQTLTVSMLSKYLSTRPQGRWMAFVTAGGSIGRIFFPLIAGTFDQFFGLDGAWMFCLILSLVNIGVTYLVLFIFPYKQIQILR